MRNLVAILLFASGWGAVAATNSVCSLVIKGGTTASVLPWSPWSCWWLLPATNAAALEVLQSEGETNKVSHAADSRMAETNVVKGAEGANADGGAANQNVAEFGVRILSGRPIGHRNVEMGEQNLQPGKPAMQPGANNAQIGQAQQSGPSAGSPLPGKAGIGQPNGGIGQAKP